MILKGSERGNARQLADHLLNVMDNDHVDVHRLQGFIANDVHGAFEEIHAISKATNCKKFLFSLSLSPPSNEMVRVEDFEAVIDQAMERLGLADQPHVIIFHEKNGRRHAHLVVSRIDTKKLRAITLSFYKERLNALGREIYLSHGWDMPDGFTDRIINDPLNFGLEEWQTSKRAKRDPKALKSIMRDCWARSDDQVSFEAALKEQGFWLARGDKRSFVAIDHKGTIYSLSRWLGVKPQELKTRLGTPGALPSIEERLTEISATFDGAQGDKAEAAETNYADQMDGLQQQRQRIVERQRLERLDLKSIQQSRRIEEAKARSLKLNTGIRGLWDRLTGNHQKFIAENKAILESTAARDRLEQQELIEGHKGERQQLQTHIDRLSKHQEIGRADLAAKIGSACHNPDIADIAKRIHEKPETLLDIITKEKSVFSEKDIESYLGKYIPDMVDRQATKSAIMNSAHLVGLTDGENRQTNIRYSTHDQVNLEHGMVHTVKIMADSDKHAVHPRLIAEAIKHQNTQLKKTVRGSLSDEQSEAISHITGKEQISAIVGLAGSGKSTMLAAAKDAWEAQGYRVLGAALAGKAADGLQNASGIKSRTLASYEMSWRNGRHELSENDVLVIDEAGMIGSRQMARFVAHAKSKGAKLVLVGDPAQLQAIGAGAPFRTISERIGFAELEHIRRQRVDWQCEASLNLARGSVAEALHSYDTHAAITFTQNSDNAIAELVEDYMADCDFGETSATRIALTHRRADVKTINESIRQRWKDRGKLANETIIETENGTRSFASGDRILFTQNEHALGVKNGTLGTLLHMDGDKLTIRLDDQEKNSNARSISINLHDYAALDHGYATTIHKSQGCTVDSAFVLAAPSMDRNLTYVALSRHRESAKLYAGHDAFKDMRALTRKLARKREKEMTLDYQVEERRHEKFHTELSNNRGHLQPEMC
uniref:Ti-type conjugative transfer relaxase TraA n=1 Tax=Pararhizobium sp. IMCC3301 TaxID=3067904 RepID=UPI0027413121|nr:Ti-type conjugative transfer relaxase TraA [Pararhizobium sp. IMCC3301]